MEGLIPNISQGVTTIINPVTEEMSGAIPPTLSDNGGAVAPALDTKPQDENMTKVGVNVSSNSHISDKMKMNEIRNTNLAVNKISITTLMWPDVGPLRNIARIMTPFHFWNNNKNNPMMINSIKYTLITGWEMSVEILGYGVSK
jgi:hypothetical protein